LSAHDTDSECIYCRYSQYALKESLKVFCAEGSESPIKETSENKAERLVKMFQNQLFKRSFINTSLMIIQKKMNEKQAAERQRRQQQ